MKKRIFLPLLVIPKFVQTASSIYIPLTRDQSHGTSFTGSYFFDQVRRVKEIEISLCLNRLITLSLQTYKTDPMSTRDKRSGTETEDRPALLEKKRVNLRIQASKNMGRAHTSKVRSHASEVWGPIPEGLPGRPILSSSQLGFPKV